jgi:hypothetical protein
MMVAEVSQSGVRGHGYEKEAELSLMLQELTKDMGIPSTIHSDKA